MTGLVALLQQRLGAAFAAVAGGHAEPAVRRSQRADFQADGALALARKLGRPPRDVAADVLAQDPLDDLCATTEIAGPGFVNLTLRADVLGDLVTTMAADQRLGVPPADAPDTVVIDYSAPNAAKEMHVGHLRSTIIGDAAARVLGWLGHRVIRQNHVGDWGTPFGMLVEQLLDQDDAEHSIGDLNAFYRQAREKFDTDDGFRERSRARVVALQRGDEPTLRLWRTIVDLSARHYAEVYTRLGVLLTDADLAGESRYQPMLDDVAKELDRLGLLRESDGASCVFPAGFTNRDGDPLPLIVRKADGGYGYDTTDLAAIRYRIADLGATRLLYVVGSPQREHFQLIFQAAREAGWLTEGVRAEHIAFGSVLGTDGRMLRTRAGHTIRLTDLLDEAVTRAADKIRDRDVDTDTVARAVGIGAVKYADLSTDRTKDYTFDYDRMLAFDGNTGPYLQYAHARVQSILRRADEPPGQVTVAEPAERDLAIALLGFPDTIADLAETLEPHRLCAYLYALATTFTTFYESCPVLRADPTTRASRLALCALTARVLAHGLDLLGIEAPDRM
ncbi:arginine--tRNA ligase [Actinophytocola gossypii]|uniref:Arginine--tRNA ligase n=1 Tax=Actinophytocola gossypii TaxID=2812003 RepID=A0ABT2JDZ2_9PSEU|nr:arginine--tRNA ligase [Actinophytocola gossypii]MCT2586101.1 arginine--tRNA ligase [Actinophytocola gossypii]